jgi:hypothetical protein
MKIMFAYHFLLLVERPEPSDAHYYWPILQLILEDLEMHASLIGAVFLVCSSTNLF